MVLIPSSKLPALLFSTFLTLGVNQTVFGQDTRDRWIERLGNVKIGMGKEEVAQISGEPHSIVEMPDGQTSADIGSGVSWRFGRSSKAGVATLGEIQFDGLGKVVLVRGDEGQAFSHRQISEERLCELIILIDDLPGLVDDNYDPLVLIETANALQPLGQKVAFSVIREYIRVTEGTRHGPLGGLSMVIRCLHVIPDEPGHLPRLGPGVGVEPSAPREVLRYPCYPLKFIDGIPFNLAVGIRGSSDKRFLLAELSRFEEKFEWISGRMPVSDKPEMELVTLISDLKREFVEDSETEIARIVSLEDQLIRFIQSRDALNKR